VKNPESGNYQNMHSAPVLPNYLGLPFQILVSPFVRFDPVGRTTDIMMFNSKNLGALIVQEEPHVKSWEDGQYSIQNMSIEETYGFGRRPHSTLGLSLPAQKKHLAHARGSVPPEGRSGDGKDFCCESGFSLGGPALKSGCREQGKALLLRSTITYDSSEGYFGDKIRIATFDQLFAFTP